MIHLTDNIIPPKRFTNPHTKNISNITVTGDDDSQSFVTPIKHNYSATAKKLPCSITVIVTAMKM